MFTKTSLTDKEQIKPRLCLISAFGAVITAAFALFVSRHVLFDKDFPIDSLVCTKTCVSVRVCACVTGIRVRRALPLSGPLRLSNVYQSGAASSLFPPRAERRTKQRGLVGGNVTSQSPILSF